MEKQASAIIVEPRLVLRKALELLLGKRCRVVGGLSSIADIASSPATAEDPDVVIVGAQPTGESAKSAEIIRSRWRASKIVLLYDDLSYADFHNLPWSPVDGCIPLSVSSASLISMLDLIVTRNMRIVVLSGTNAAPRLPQVVPRRGDHETSRPVSNTHLGAAVVPEASSVRWDVDTHKCGPECSTPLKHGPESNTPKLSEREIQVLAGLVAGHANRGIALGCNITEASVKVIMKSVLRKIRVGNRTQAAIWALQHRPALTATEIAEERSRYPVKPTALPMTGA